MASRPTPSADFEPAGELKIGQVGIANLRVRTLDVAALVRETIENYVTERAAKASKAAARTRRKAP